MTIKLRKRPLDIRQQQIDEINKLPTGSVVVPTFENPNDGSFLSSPSIIIETNIYEIKIRSPPIPNLQPGTWHRFILQIYSDSTQTNKIGEHNHLLFARMSEFNLKTLGFLDDIEKK